MAQPQTFSIHHNQGVFWCPRLSRCHENIYITLIWKYNVDLYIILECTSLHCSATSSEFSIGSLHAVICMLSVSCGPSYNYWIAPSGIWRLVSCMSSFFLSITIGLSLYLAYLIYRKCTKAMGKTLIFQSNMHHHILFMTLLTKERQTNIVHMLERAFSRKQDRINFKQVARILINR